MIFTVQIKVIEPMVMSSFFFGGFMAERKSGSATYVHLQVGCIIASESEDNLHFNHKVLSQDFGENVIDPHLGGQNRSLQSLKPSIIEGRRMS